jgi:poly(3-hydroxybutyrate) depolymerase
MGNSWRHDGADSGVDGTEDGGDNYVSGYKGAVCVPSKTADMVYQSCKDNGIAKNTCSWVHCQADDVEFVVALITELSTNLCIDTSRIFSTGVSNGGEFSW